MAQRSLRSVSGAAVTTTATDSTTADAGVEMHRTTEGAGQVTEVTSFEAAEPAPTAALPGVPVTAEVIADGPAPAGVVEAPGLPATATSNALPAKRDGALTFDPASGLIGDWDQSDIRFPAIRIVQGSGTLSQTWPQGTLLFGEEELLPTPDLRMPKPEHVFRFVPITIEKQFRENLSEAEIKGGAQARIVNTIAEVEAMGGTTQWIGNEKPSWSPCARVLLLLECPSALKDASGAPISGAAHPAFVLEFGGKRYAPAVWYASGAGFTNGVKPIFNAAVTMLTVPQIDPATGQPMKTAKGGIMRVPYLPKSFWTWRTVRKPAGEHMIFTCEVRLDREETGTEIREFIDTLRS